MKRGWDAGLGFQTELPDSLLYIPSALGEEMTSRISSCDRNGSRSTITVPLSP